LFFELKRKEKIEKGERGGKETKKDVTISICGPSPENRLSPSPSGSAPDLNDERRCCCPVVGKLEDDHRVPAKCG